MFIMSGSYVILKIGKYSPAELVVALFPEKTRCSLIIIMYFCVYITFALSEPLTRSGGCIFFFPLASLSKIIGLRASAIIHGRLLINNCLI